MNDLENHMVIGPYYPEPDPPREDEDAAYERVRQQEIDDAADAIRDLSLRNRAYNLLYALGDYTPTDVPTFAPGEAARLIQIAREALAGDRSTELHRRLAALKPHRLRYAIEGTI